MLFHQSESIETAHSRLSEIASQLFILWRPMSIPESIFQVEHSLIHFPTIFAYSLSTQDFIHKDSIFALLNFNSQALDSKSSGCYQHFQ